MEQLGLLYLRKHQLDQAERVFDDMSQLKGGQLETEYRTKALAGQIVLADLRGEPDERIDELLDELKSRKFDYLSELGRYVDIIDRRLRSRSNDYDSD